MGLLGFNSEPTASFVIPVRQPAVLHVLHAFLTTWADMEFGKCMQADSDGDVVEFSVLVSQMFEFILTVVGNSKFLPLLQPVLPELAYLTLGAATPIPPSHICVMRLATLLPSGEFCACCQVDFLWHTGAENLEFKYYPFLHVLLFAAHSSAAQVRRCNGGDYNCQPGLQGRKQFKQRIAVLSVETCAGYMQMTTDQEETWAEDPNVFVADEEDDMFSVRTSGELVLEEVVRQADGAAGILAGAVRRRMDEAAAAQVTQEEA